MNQEGLDMNNMYVHKSNLATNSFYLFLFVIFVVINVIWKTCSLGKSTRLKEPFYLTNFGTVAL